jgi:hypothetical protein
VQVSDDAAKRYDVSMRSALQSLANVDDTDYVRMLAHLPARNGGLGICRPQWKAPHAHRASVESVFLGRAAPSQASLMKQQFANTEQTLLQFHGVDDLLQRNKRAGTAAWLNDPSFSANADAFAALLRLRLGVPVAGCPAEIACPGCLKTMGRFDFVAHAPGCVRICGTNASTSHACLKQAFKRLLDHAGLRYEASEPRDLHTVACPGCSVSVSRLSWSAHATSCKHLRADQRRVVPRAHGPDLRYWLKDDQPPHVLDFTVVYDCSPTHRKEKLSDLFASREALKRAHYQAQCDRNGDRFVVAAVSSSGTLSPEFTAEVSAVANAGGLTFKRSMREISASVSLAVAHALLNAERAACIAAPSKYADMVSPPQTLTTSLAIPAARPPLETTASPAAYLPGSLRALQATETAVRDRMDSLVSAFYADLHHQNDMWARRLLPHHKMSQGRKRTTTTTEPAFAYDAPRESRLRRPRVDTRQLQARRPRDRTAPATVCAAPSRPRPCTSSSAPAHPTRHQPDVTAPPDRHGSPADGASFLSQLSEDARVLATLRHHLVEQIRTGKAEISGLTASPAAPRLTGEYVADYSRPPPELRSRREQQLTALPPSSTSPRSRTGPPRRNSPGSSDATTTTLPAGQTTKSRNTVSRTASRHRSASARSREPVRSGTAGIPPAADGGADISPRSSAGRVVTPLTPAPVSVRAVTTLPPSSSMSHPTNTRYPVTRTRSAAASAGGPAACV